MHLQAPPHRSLPGVRFGADCSSRRPARSAAGAKLFREGKSARPFAPPPFWVVDAFLGTAREQRSTHTQSLTTISTQTRSNRTPPPAAVSQVVCSMMTLTTENAQDNVVLTLAYAMIVVRLVQLFSRQVRSAMDPFIPDRCACMPADVCVCVCVCLCVRVAHRMAM